MKRLLLLFAIFFHFNSQAQLAPIGTLWNYFATHIHDGIPSSLVQLYTITKDTLLAGKVYSEIVEDRTNMRFYRTLDSGKVYFWVNEQHNLLFDMNVKVYDTLTVAENNGYDNQVTQVTHKIDSIYFVKDKKGDSLKVYQTSSRRTFTEKALSINNYLIYNYLPYESQVSIGVELRCYVEPGIFSFLYIDSSNCDYVNIKEVSDMQNRISVYPNPAQQKIFIQNDTRYNIHHLEFYDLTGKKIHATNQNNVTEVETGMLSSGNYWLVMEFTDHSRIIKKITIAPR